MSTFAPHAHFDLRVLKLVCRECQKEGTTLTRNAVIPRERDHDECRAIARRRVEKRAQENKKLRRKQA